MLHLQKIARHGISLQRHVTSPFFIICHIFISSRRHFLHGLFCGSTCILLHTYSCCNILQRLAYIFAVRIVIILFSIHIISTIVSLFTSCCTFHWFDINITPTLILFLSFDCITHSLYCTWLIAFNKLFLSLTYQCFHSISLQGFQQFSFIIQVGWAVFGS